MLRLSIVVILVATSLSCSDTSKKSEGGDAKPNNSEGDGSGKHRNRQQAPTVCNDDYGTPYSKEINGVCTVQFASCNGGIDTSAPCDSPKFSCLEGRIFLKDLNKNECREFHVNSCSKFSDGLVAEPFVSKTSCEKALKEPIQQQAPTVCNDDYGTPYSKEINGVCTVQFASCNGGIDTSAPCDSPKFSCLEGRVFLKDLNKNECREFRVNSCSKFPDGLVAEPFAEITDCERSFIN